jgi:hypothetical protein
MGVRLDRYADAPLPDWMLRDPPRGCAASCIWGEILAKLEGRSWENPRRLHAVCFAKLEAVRRRPINSTFWEDYHDPSWFPNRS